MIVNADEGEPGTIKDRYVMELRPQLLLEGLVAAMRFCETDQAYIYLREEYGTARARAAGGDRGARHPGRARRRRRRVHLRRGDGDARVDGRTPRHASAEAAVPGQSGYLGRPTLINNVETLAHVALILRGGWQPARLWSVTGAVAKPAATRRLSMSRSAA